MSEAFVLGGVRTPFARSVFGPANAAGGPVGDRDAASE
jgi:hypothetical protein